MLGIIVQARLQSSRLPKKIILPFYKEKGIVELLLENLRMNFNQYPLIIATTTNPIDNKLVEIGKKLGIIVFRGDENNVLERFIMAAEKSGIQKIIRVCADNPLLNMNDLKYLIDDFENEEVDYIGFETSNNVPTIKTHYGLWAEGVTLNALKKISNLTKDGQFLEHVTNYIYTNRLLFKQKYLPIPETIEQKKLRLTVDTVMDFEVCKAIYNAICENKNIEDVSKLASFVWKNDDWVKKMEMQITLNSK